MQSPTTSKQKSDSKQMFTVAVRQELLREFKAIVAAKGRLINDVINEMLEKWTKDNRQILAKLRRR